MSKLLRVPHQLQLADGYCLPACAQMVLEYFGIVRAQADIARQIGMIPNGGTPASRIKALESSKLRVSYLIGEIADLQAAVDQGVPPIALLLTNELSYWNETSAHAVVVVAFEGDRILVNDPAMPNAPIRVPISEFQLAWDEMSNRYALIEPG